MTFLMIALKLIIGYMGLLFVIRAVGKKTLSDLTPFDIIYSLLLGGILEQTIYDNEIRIIHLLFALTVWGGIIYIMEVLLRNNKNPFLKTKGSPSVLIFKGQLNLKELKKNNLEMEDLRTMLREQGSFSLKNIQYAILEINGKFSVIAESNTEDYFNYLVIGEGKIKKFALQSMGKSEEWLRMELEKENHSDIEQLIYAEWSEEKGFFCKSYSDCINQQIHLDG